MPRFTGFVCLLIIATYARGQSPAVSDPFAVSLATKSVAALTGGNGNGRTRDAQKFGEELDAGVVGFAINRRRSYRQLKRIANFSSDCVLLSARMNFDAEGNIIR